MNVEHFRARVLQDAFNEALGAYWLRRAESFERVGTARCDEIARACRNAAALAVDRDDIDEDVWSALKEAA